MPQIGNVKDQEEEKKDLQVRSLVMKEQKESSTVCTCKMTKDLSDTWEM